MDYQNIENQNVDESCMGLIHKIEKGDTLYRLSKTYGIPVSSLMLANPYVNVYSLQVGDELCIPQVTPVAVEEMETEIPGEMEEPSYDEELMLEGSQPEQMENYSEQSEAVPAASYEQMPVFDEEMESAYEEAYVRTNGVEPPAQGLGNLYFRGNETIHEVLNGTGITMDDFNLTMQNLVREIG